MPVTIPSPRAKKHARIEIVPLIDIIFFLLATFVMVSLSMVKNRAVPVNLPGATTAQPQEQKDSATISIGESGDLYFNKEPVTESDLERLLQVMIANNPEPRIFIAGDSKAQFGRAVAMLDLVRRKGITKVAIQTKNRGSGQEAAPGGAIPAAPGEASAVGLPSAAPPLAPPVTDSRAPVSPP